MIRTEKVNTHQVVSKILPPYLVKNLTENERICPECNGLGLKVNDNIYGIKGDTSELARKYMFPYKHQSLSFCQSCYNGVQRLCPYCGKPYKRQSYLHCECDGQRQADREKKLKELKKIIKNAVEVKESEVTTMLYCEENGEFYDTVDDFFDYYAWHKDDFDVRPFRLWVTTEESIHMDANNLIEDACSDLHEDAFEQCDADGLQKLLDKWCKEQTGTSTYYPCYKEYVIIHWEMY